MTFMLSIAEIRAMPTTTTDAQLVEPSAGNGLHESLFRSYQILRRVKWLLREGTPTTVVMQEIEEMEFVPNQPEAAKQP